MPIDARTGTFKHVNIFYPHLNIYIIVIYVFYRLDILIYPCA